MEICDIVFTEIDCEAPTWRSGLEVIVEADAWRVQHQEMTSRLANEGRKDAARKSKKVHHLCGESS